MSQGKQIIQCPKCSFTFDISYGRTFACSGCPSLVQCGMAKMSTLTFTKSRPEELARKEDECCPLLLLHFALNLELPKLIVLNQASSINQREAS